MAQQEGIVVATEECDGARLWFEISRLATDYWRDVDFDGGTKAHEFFIEQGVFAVGQNRFEGRSDIKKYYCWRRWRGNICTRHVLSNVVVEPRPDRQATLHGVVTLYLGAGRPPFSRATVPALVADATCECARGPDGAWRFVSHVLDPIYLGEHVPMSLSVNTQFLATLQFDEAGAEAKPVAAR
jgi:hypothetical protein